MFKSFLRRFLFISKHKHNDTIKNLTLHNSDVLGWPKYPTLNIKSEFPTKITIDAGPIPMLRPVKPIEFLYLEQIKVFGVTRATYIQAGEPNDLCAVFLWVFKTH